MRRFALLGAAVLGLATGAVACGANPVEPAASAAAYDTNPSFGKTSTTTATSTNCAAVVYPTSLCLPANRPALCAALRNGGTLYEPVVGREAKEVFEVTATGSVETAYVSRPYGFPPAILKFTITTAQIESVGMCRGVS